MRKVLKSSHYLSRLWRNGQGTTREIIVWPEGAGELFDWRISLADLKVSGPFSLYPGVDRILVILEGEEIVLTQNGERNPLPLMTPLAFDGNLPTMAEVKTMGRDFNLMLRQGKVKGKISVRSGVSEIKILSKFIGFFSLQDIIVDAEPLQANDFFLMVDEEDGTVIVNSPGEFLVIEISERNL